MPANYGADIRCLTDLDPNFTLHGGPEMVKYALARRLLTPRGSLPFHPDYGLDVRAFLSKRMDATVLGDVASAVEGELLKDARVAEVSAVASYDVAARRLIIEVDVRLVEGESVNFAVEVSALDPANPTVR